MNLDKFKEVVEKITFNSIVKNVVKWYLIAGLILVLIKFPQAYIQLTQVVVGFVNILVGLPAFVLVNGTAGM